jgi:hypothetical protein
MIASITLPLAHAGHWAFSVLALAPILFAAALVAVQSMRGGRRGMGPAAMTDDADGPDPPGDPLER